MALEIKAFKAIAETLVSSPRGVAQRLVDLAMELTGADSTGLSLEDECDGQPVFRWVATAGELRPHLHQTLPRDF
ncbi:MAG: histidine kinase, partial [Methylibium sp.]|nr:histidine kinase [Methylibium sp.]